MIGLVKDAAGRNPARAFHGSFSGTVKVHAMMTVSTGKTIVFMTIKMHDDMTATSGTRAPSIFGGYSDPPTAIFPIENPYGKDGQFRTISIDYNMFHTVTIQ